MARTSSSRGVSGFKMRSGNSPMQGWGDWFKKAALGPLSLFGGGGGGDDEVPGVEGTIATDEQKADLGIDTQKTALGGGQDILGGKGEGNKLKAIARIIASDKGGIGNPNTMLTKKYKYKK